MGTQPLCCLTHMASVRASAVWSWRLGSLGSNKLVGMYSLQVALKTLGCSCKSVDPAVLEHTMIISTGTLYASPDGTSRSSPNSVFCTSVGSKPRNSDAALLDAHDGKKRQNHNQPTPPRGQPPAHNLKGGREGTRHAASALLLLLSLKGCRRPTRRSFTQPGYKETMHSS